MLMTLYETHTFEAQDGIFEANKVVKLRLTCHLFSFYYFASRIEMDVSARVRGYMCDSME